MDAWVQLTTDEYDHVWDRFCAAFSFRPSVHAKDFPGITESPPFITLDLFGDFDEQAIDELDATLLTAFRKSVAPDHRLYALDWQHDCYWFYPHRNADEPVIPIIPDGDYSIFLSQDFTFGTFGHPWERTLCVFGADLVSAIPSDLIDSLRIKRRGDGPT